MKRLVFTVALLAASGVLLAQEAGTAPATETSGDLAAAAAAATADGGQEIANKAAEMAAKYPAEEPSDKFVSAEDQVKKDLKRWGLSLVYDEKKKAIISIGSFALKLKKDPATDKSFGRVREQFAAVAYLKAKSGIIQSINAKVSGEDRFFMSMTDTDDEEDVKATPVKKALEAKRAELADALREYSATDAKFVTDVTPDDRYNAFLDAVIKKIDKDYSPDSIAAKKKLDAAEAKKAHDALNAKVQALKAEFEACKELASKVVKDPSLETASTAKIISKMPLLGSSILTQAESYDKDTMEYSVAMAVVWSPKLQEAAVKLATGDTTPSGKPGKSEEEWIASRNWSSMMGVHRFVNDKGHQIFVATFSVALTGSSLTQDAKKESAKTMASKNVPMALTGDLESYREASQNMKIYEAEDDSNTIDSDEKFSMNVAQKMKDKNLKGCKELYSETFTHPITGHKMFVSAFYIDPVLSPEAGKFLENAYAAAEHIEKHSQRENGRHQGMQDSLNAALASNAEFNRGRAEGKAAVDKAVAEREAAAAAARAAAGRSRGAAGSGASAVPQGEKKAQGGTYTSGSIDLAY